MFKKFPHLLLRVWIFLYYFVIHSFTYMEKQQNVRAELNALQVEEWAHFPLTRYEYCLSCRTKLQDATGKKFKSQKQKDTGRVYFQRTT